MPRTHATYDSGFHAAHPSPNLLSQAPPPGSPGQQLVSDITRIPTREGWLYLAVVIDLFSRAILGWKLGESLGAELVSASLRRALDSGIVAPDALFHSDRGCQYSAASTRSLLAGARLRQSMSAAGYCHDNAFAESTFASLKNEMLEDSSPCPPRPPHAPPSSTTSKPSIIAAASTVPSTA